MRTARIMYKFAISQTNQPNLYKTTITMNKNNSFKQEVHSYETPSVNVLNVQAEGVLCGSFDDPSYGYDDENDLGEI